MGNNPSQQAAALTTAISQDVVDVLQSSVNTQNVSQEVKNDCTKYVMPDGCIDGISNLCYKNKYSADQCTELAIALCSCSISNVNLKQTVYVSASSSQYTAINSSIQNSVSTTLSQAAKDSGADQEAKAASKSVVGVLSKIRQTIYDSVSASQIVHNIGGGGGYVAGITMDQTVNIITNIIQKDTTTQSAINKLATTITQSSVNTMNWVMYVGIIIIILFIVIFLILMLSKSKDLKDFFYKILPVLIWFVCSLIVTFILILTKPSFITYTLKNDDGSSSKYIDVAKLIMYLTLIYIGFAIIITVVFKIKNKLDKNKLDNLYPDISQPNSSSSSDNLYPDISQSSYSSDNLYPNT